MSDSPLWTRLQPFLATVLVLSVIGIPLWLVFVTAGKSRGEALTPNLALPSQWHLAENLAMVWREAKVPAALLGSVLTVVLLLRQLGLAGTAVGMVDVYMGIYLSTVIFFVTGFVRTIPDSLEEAAQIDGAGPIKVFTRIVLPMLRPVLATATILICLYVWNDVFYAFFVVGGRLDTLPLNLFQIASAGLYLNNWHLIFAYVILMSVPLVAVFAVAQRQIISGITSGAIK